MARCRDLMTYVRRSLDRAATSTFRFLVSIVGRRGNREALPLLLTLSSGVKGFTTIHAGSARQALTRLRFICQLADTANEVPMSALNSLVSEAVDLVVFCRRTADGPQVAEVIAVEDLAAGPEATQFTVTEVFARRGSAGQLEWTGNLPSRAARAFDDAGIDLHTAIDQDGDAGWEPF